MNELSGSISELVALRDIEELSELYEEEYGYSPFNVSHWDPSLEFKKAVSSCLKLPIEGSFIDYEFSYTLERRREALEAFNFSQKIHGCLITPSGSV